MTHTMTCLFVIKLFFLTTTQRRKEAKAAEKGEFQGIIIKNFIEKLIVLQVWSFKGR